MNKNTHAQVRKAKEDTLKVVEICHGDGEIIDILTISQSHDGYYFFEEDTNEMKWRTFDDILFASDGESIPLSPIILQVEGLNLYVIKMEFPFNLHVHLEFPTQELLS